MVFEKVGHRVRWQLLSDLPPGLNLKGHFHHVALHEAHAS
jgi:hypothetical protein